MAVWNPFVITDVGLSTLSSAVLRGDKLNITRLQSSESDFTGVDLAKLTELPGGKQSFAVLSVTKLADTQIKVEAIMNNIGLAADYNLTALGIYAKVGDGGEEFLFAVKTASEPDTMPKTENGVVKTTTYKMIINISNASSIQVSIDLDTYVTRSMCNDISHPVGIIVITDGSWEPADKFGGTWEKITGKYLMASGDYNGKTYKAGDVAGEETHKISYNEMPRHGHTRGTMEITGGFPADDSQVGRHAGYHVPDGAFYTGETLNGYDLDSDTHGNDAAMIRFQASRTWTGLSSIEGLGQAMPLMPACLVVDVWKRKA